MNTTEQKHVRPSWDEYFLKIVEVVGTRGTCDRGHAACVITRDRRILSTGYAGAPMGIAHCDDVGHELHKVINDDGTESTHCIRTTHAEQNAIAQAARNGVSIDGSTLYCNMTPCYTCAKILITAGIKRVVANKDYHRAQRSKDIFKEAGIELQIIHPDVETYKDMK